MDGVEEILFNIYKNIDREKIQFDFLSPNKTTFEIHRKEIEEMGGHLYGLNININKSKIMSKVIFGKEIKNFLKKNNYDIVHINSGRFFLNLIVARFVRKSKVKRIIVHSHNSLNEKEKMKNKIIKACKPLLNLYVTDFLACSQKAADDMFTKNIAKNKAIIIKNGIDVDKFKFNSKTREKVRKELQIDNDTFVIGHVGRFEEQKNHKFLIDIFSEIHKKDKNAILLLIGEGDLKLEIESKVKDLKLENNVKFLGMRNDVPDLMQAMDCFVLPSFHEGLPIVGIEAQATGLKCVMSNVITDEVNITRNVEFLDLTDTAIKWADEVLKKGNINRNEMYKVVKSKDYDIKQTAKVVENIYLKKFSK